MKYSHHISLLIWLIYFCLSLSAQNTSIVKLREESTTGKYRAEIPPEAPGLVDLNSVIRIQINRTEVEQALFEMAGVSTSSDRLAKLKSLNRLLEHETEIVRMLNEEIRSNQSVDLRTYSYWAQLEENLKQSLQENDSMLYDEINQRMLGPEMDAFEDKTDAEFIIYVIHEKADELRKELTKELGLDESADSSLLVYFRLGAFLKNRQGGRPIHVENFDNYQAENFSEIQRFGTPISEDENREIQNNVRLVSELRAENKNTVKSLEQMMKREVKSLFTSQKAYDSLLFTRNRMYSSHQAKPERADFIQILNENFGNLNLIGEAYKLIATSFNQLSDQSLNTVLLESIPQNIAKELSASVSRARGQFDLLASAANMKQPKPLGTLELDTLSSKYNDLGNAVSNDIRGVQNFVSKISDLFSIFKKSSLKSEAFTDKVKHFRPGNIPAEGFIELKYIGERRPGDEILIKATLERGKSQKNPNFEQKEVFRRYLSLQRIAAHVKMSASLILANPYNRDQQANVTLKNKHQFAASYGVFLKWGSRKNRFYNEFINLGIGMSFSSPDFNLDGTPEFGAGAVVTALRDWVSVGWGWNFGVDAPYTFIGFNIPFTVAGFSSPSASGGF